MFCGPHFPVSCAFVQFLDLIMRIVIPWAWTLISKESCIHMEVSFLIYFDFLLVLLQQFLYVLKRLFEMVSADSWNRIFLLLHLHPIVNGVFR